MLPDEVRRQLSAALAFVEADAASVDSVRVVGE